MPYLWKTTLCSPNRSRTEIWLRNLYRIDQNCAAHFSLLSKIGKYKILTVFDKYDVVCYTVRFQKIVPNHFNQTTLTCIVWWYQMWYMWWRMWWSVWWRVWWRVWWCVFPPPPHPRLGRRRGAGGGRGWGGGIYTTTLFTTLFTTFFTTLSQYTLPKTCVQVAITCFTPRIFMTL